MKTITVKPILIDSKEPTFIGSIMECIKLFKYDNEGKAVGEIVLNINPYVTSSNEYWQHKELILISLDSKEYINKGDIYYNKRLNKVFLAISNDGYPSNEDVKVIARQSKISPSYIQQFIEEYNNDKVEDIEIEMEEVIDPDGLSKLNKLEGYRLHPDDLPNCCFILQPKLTNGFITIVERVAIVSNKSKYPIGGYAPGNYTCNCVTCKTTFIGDKRAIQCESCAIKTTTTPILYTEDEVKELCFMAMSVFTEGFKEWFNDNKKK